MEKAPVGADPSPFRAGAVSLAARASQG
jgi:hypothetical protein